MIIVGLGLLLVNVRLFIAFFIDSFSDDVLAVGSYLSHKKAEVLNTERDTWSKIDDYPYDKGLIFFDNMFSTMSSRQKFNLS